MSGPVEFTQRTAAEANITSATASLREMEGKDLPADVVKVRAGVATAQA